MTIDHPVAHHVRGASLLTCAWAVRRQRAPSQYGGIDDSRARRLRSREGLVRRHSGARTRGGSRVRRVLALIGIAAGLVVYVASFFINAPIEVCAAQPPPAEWDRTAPLEAIAVDSSKSWVFIVATRCNQTYADGTHTSNLVVEWGPSVLAIAGLVVAASALWIWLGSRARSRPRRSDHPRRRPSQTRRRPDTRRRAHTAHLRRLDETATHLRHERSELQGTRSAVEGRSSARLSSPQGRP